MPFCLEIKRILKKTGSFVLDIGGAWVPGVPVRSVYHFELAVELAKEFFLAQEFYWFNPARLPTPAEWVTVRRLRVKDAVNMVWWFGKSEWPNADNRRILQPYSESMKELIQKRLQGAEKALRSRHIDEVSTGQRRGDSAEPHSDCKHGIEQRISSQVQGARNQTAPRAIPGTIGQILLGLSDRQG